MGLHHHIPGLGRKFGGYVKDHANSYRPSQNGRNPGEGFFSKAGAERNIDNLWTGRERTAYGKMGTAAIGLGATGLAAWAAAPIAHERRTDQAVQMQREEGDIESLISTRGDESGYSVNLRSLSDLQSQGDLVFALNRLRN